MPTSESIEPTCRVLAASGDPSPQATRNLKQEYRRSLILFLVMLCCLSFLLCLLHGPEQLTVQQPALSVSPNDDQTSTDLAAAAEHPAPITVFRVESAEALISKLKKNHLWEIKAGSSIAPLLLASYPADLGTLSIAGEEEGLSEFVAARGPDDQCRNHQGTGNAAGNRQQNSPTFFPAYLFRASRRLAEIC